MADHDHDDEVAEYGECITCVRRDGAAAKEAREDAISAAGSGADEDWMAMACRAVITLASAGGEFTTDDVWEVVPSTREPRALGAVMRWAVGAGLVVRTGRVTPSRRTECHARPVAVWRSRYEAETAEAS